MCVCALYIWGYIFHFWWLTSIFYHINAGKIETHSLAHIHVYTTWVHTTSIADFEFYCGLPAVLLCCEFSFIFLYAQTRFAECVYVWCVWVSARLAIVSVIGDSFSHHPTPPPPATVNIPTMPPIYDLHVSAQLCNIFCRNRINDLSFAFAVSYLPR